MATTPPKPSLDIGRVLGRGFEAIKANFLPFTLVAFLLSGVPGFLTQYWMITGVASLNFDYIMSFEFWGPVAGGIFLSAIAGILLQAALVRSTILQLGGRTPDIGASISGAFGLILPIIGLTICVGFLVTLGLIALVVPGIMLICAFIVAIPALIEERRGVFAAMQRSRDLTRGYRWQVFLLLIVFYIFSAIVGAILGVVTGATMNPYATMGADPTMALPDPILSGVGTAITNTFTSLLTSVVLAALYVELRTVKEGASTEDLAGVFN